MVSSRRNSTIPFAYSNFSYFVSDISETNAVFCPKYWVKFRTSCYKPYTSKKVWDDALATCKQVQGATLVSLDDKEEEDYVKNIMNSKGVGIFHAWPRTRFALHKYGFMCEYKLGEVYGLRTK